MLVTQLSHVLYYHPLPVAKPLGLAVGRLAAVLPHTPRVAHKLATLGREPLALGKGSLTP